MKYLKKYQKFFEDGEGGGTAYVNASTAGMDGVVSAQVGALPGVPGESGSGDRGNILGGVKTKKPIDSFSGEKEKKCRKKGKPNQVTDLRDLKEEDIEEVKE